MIWSTKSLRRFGAVVNGGTPTTDAENWDGEIPWATPVDVGQANGRVVGQTTRCITESGLQSGSRSVGAGSVIVSTRAPVGYAARVNSRTAFNQGCRGIQPFADVHPGFLVYSLLSETPQLERRSNGTTFLELGTNAMKEVRLPAPPLDHQVTICEFLDRETARIDELIAEQEALAAALGRRRAATIAAMLQGDVETDGRLKHAVTSVRQGWSPQCEATPRDGDHEWAVLKTGCVNRGVFRPGENKRLPEGVPPRPETVVRRGEIVVARASTRDLVGSAAQIGDDHSRLMLSDKLYALTIDLRVAEPEFVALRLGTRTVRDQIELAASGASHSMQNISQRDILSLPMGLPDLLEQREALAAIGTSTRPLDDLVAECRALITLLKERRAALITAAVTGQIDVR